MTEENKEYEKRWNDFENQLNSFQTYEEFITDGIVVFEIDDGDVHDEFSFFLYKFNKLFDLLLNSKNDFKQRIYSRTIIIYWYLWIYEYMDAYDIESRNNIPKPGVLAETGQYLVLYYKWWIQLSTNLIKEFHDNNKYLTHIKILCDVNIFLNPISYLSKYKRKPEEWAKIYKLVSRIFVMVKKIDNEVLSSDYVTDMKTKERKEHKVEWNDFHVGIQKIREMVMRTRELMLQHGVKPPKIPGLKKSDLIKGTRGGIGHWQKPSPIIPYDANPPPRTKGVQKERELKQIPKHFIKGPRGGYFYVGPNGTHRTYVSWWNYDNVPSFPSKHDARKYKRGNEPIQKYVKDPESRRIRKDKMGNEMNGEGGTPNRSRSPSQGRSPVSPRSSRSPNRSRSQSRGRSVTPSRSASGSRQVTPSRQASAPNSPIPFQDYNDDFYNNDTIVSFEESGSLSEDSSEESSEESIQSPKKRVSPIKLKGPPVKRGRWSERPGIVRRIQPSRKRTTMGGIKKWRINPENMETPDRRRRNKIKK
jgi:hypothetical protein